MKTVLTRCLIALSLLSVAACASPGSAIPPAPHHVAADANPYRTAQDTVVVNP